MPATYDAQTDIEISVVVPILNEYGSLLELQTQLTQVLTEVGRAYEIVYIDDGSTDGSQKLCREFAESDPHVTLVELRRNFGKAAALQVGFETARGEMIITMDGDLQDDPKEIPAFLEALDDDLDLVSGWKRDRQDPISKTLPSRLFNAVTSHLTGIPLRDFNCGFKAYRREVVEHLDLYGELYRYIPVLAHAQGFRVGEIPVEHHPRLYGKSKYSFERFFRGAFDLATVLFLRHYRRRPLHLFGLIGASTFMAGFVIDAYLALLWFLGLSSLSNRPLLLFGSLLITVGVQVSIFGLLAEMITAATYRRSEVTQSIRRVHRRDDVEKTAPR